MVSQNYHEGNALLEAALSYARRGWRIHPLRDRDKPARLKDWPELATVDEAQLRDWWQQWPQANVGLACGERSGVLVVDIDDMDALGQLEADLGALPRTPMSETPSGGRHCIFRWTDTLRPVMNKTRVGGVKLDIRTTGGYIVAPPSMAPRKADRKPLPYRWIVPPEEAEVADLPEAWVNWLLAHATATPTTSSNGSMSFTIGGGGRPDAEQRAIAYLAKAPPAISGSNGHATTLTVARAVCYGFDLGADRGFDLLMSHWNPRCSPPWTASELRHKCQEADRLPFDKPRGYLLAEERGGTGGGAASSPSATVGQEGEDIEGIPLPAPPKWPTMPPAAYDGPLGEIAQRVVPYTEADPAAILLQLLIAYGSVLGRKAFFPVGPTRHYPNLFGLVVGASAHARKGSSWDYAEAVVGPLDSRWLSGCIESGLSSAEGLIDAVRDPEMRLNEDGELEVVREGCHDKRLLAMEEEFGKVLKMFKRDGNILSDILRRAWDGKPLSVKTRGDKLRSTDHHVSFIGHVTSHDLGKYLADAELHNGYMNRFLIILARKTKDIPRPVMAPVSDLGEKLARYHRQTAQVQGMARSQDAEEEWDRIYPALNAVRPGVYGSVTARGPAQVLRLSMVYALAEGSPIVTARHQQSAYALWRYAQESCEIIFGQQQEEDDPLAALVLKKLVEAGQGGMTRTDINRAFHSNMPALQIVQALGKLRDRQQAWCRPEDTGGRPRERWFASSVVQPERNNVQSPPSEGGDTQPPDLNTLIRSYVQPSGGGEGDRTDLNTLIRSYVRHSDGTEEVTI